MVGVFVLPEGLPPNRRVNDGHHLRLCCGKAAIADKSDHLYEFPKRETVSFFFSFFSTFHQIFGRRFKHFLFLDRLQSTYGGSKKYRHAWFSRDIFVKICKIYFHECSLLCMHKSQVYRSRFPTLFLFIHFTKNHLTLQKTERKTTFFISVKLQINYHSGFSVVIIVPFIFLFDNLMKFKEIKVFDYYVMLLVGA